MVNEITSPLQIRDYRIFWLSRFSFSLASAGMATIMAYQLYDVARSDYGMGIGEAAFQLGIFGLVQFIPMMLLSPIAGVVADRFERRMVAICATLLELTVCASLALATWQDVVTLPLLFSLGVLHGATRVFIGPALGSIVPNIIPAELLPKAIAMNTLAWQIPAIAGPALAGLMFAHTPESPYAMGVVLLIISCFGLGSIRKILPPAANRDIHPFRLIAEGFRFVSAERFLLGCVTLDLFAVLLGGATALLPVYARDILHVGPEGLGQMRAAPAVGAALVGLWLSWKPITRNVGAKMLWGVAVYGAATVVFGLSPWLPLSLVALFVLGAGDMVSVYIRNSLVQLNTPDSMRGRVQSIFGLAVSASNELGEMQSGLFAAMLGATGAVVFGGGAAIVITGLWAWIFPELRNARTFAPQFRNEERAA